MKGIFLVLAALLPLINANPQRTVVAPAGITARPRPPPQDDSRPCGFKIAPCPTGQSCSRTDPTCTRGENCAGVCVPHYSNSLPPLPPITDRPPPTRTTSVRPPQRTYPACGGFRIENKPCPAGTVCMDDPRRKGCGMACDAPGICVPEKQPVCAGFIGSRCPSYLTCYDDPREDCDPENGGADCIGICL